MARKSPIPRKSEYPVMPYDDVWHAFRRAILDCKSSPVGKFVHPMPRGDVQILETDNESGNGSNAWEGGYLWPENVSSDQIDAVMEAMRWSFSVIKANTDKGIARAWTLQIHSPGGDLTPMVDFETKLCAARWAFATMVAATLLKPLGDFIQPKISQQETK